MRLIEANLRRLIVPEATPLHPPGPLCIEGGQHGREDRQRPRVPNSCVENGKIDATCARQNASASRRPVFPGVEISMRLTKVRQIARNAAKSATRPGTRYILRAPTARL